jgi:hypothetical protein
VPKRHREGDAGGVRECVGIGDGDAEDDMEADAGAKPSAAAWAWPTPTATPAPTGGPKAPGWPVRAGGRARAIANDAPGAPADAWLLETYTKGSVVVVGD